LVDHYGSEEVGNQEGSQLQWYEETPASATLRRRQGVFPF